MGRGRNCSLCCARGFVRGLGKDLGDRPGNFQLGIGNKVCSTYTVAGVIVVRKYEEQSNAPCLVTNAAASMALFYQQRSIGIVGQAQESHLPRRQLSALHALAAIAGDAETELAAIKTIKPNKLSMFAMRTQSQSETRAENTFGECNVLEV